MDFEIRMMVLLLCECCNFVEECSGLLKIFEFERAGDFLPIVTYPPLRSLLPQHFSLISRERCDAAFAGNTFFLEK